MRELNIVQTIAERFDCGAMLQIYEEIADQMQEGDDVLSSIAVQAERNQEAKEDEKMEPDETEAQLDDKIANVS